MIIAVINCGSSSIKFQIFDMQGDAVIVDGLVEGIGEPQGRVLLCYPRMDAGEKHEFISEICDHRSGLEMLIDEVTQSAAIPDNAELYCIGHRVVHGGELFKQPTLIDDEVIAGIRAQVTLAPLHNPANLVGIEAAMAASPDTPQVAVFDTAFHHSIPRQAYLYALPYKLYRAYKIRRYGFHGISHGYVTRTAAEYLNIPLQRFNAIVFHLGNGASVTAVRSGKSVDTSMGLTPLEGLVMGTRSGDIDPAIYAYLEANAGMSVGSIDAMLNRESGLKGICDDNDMRRILERAQQGDDLAQLAFDIFCYRAKKYLGAYLAVLGRVDAVIFTAGIGENSAEVRSEICAGLEGLGISVDPERNSKRGSPLEIGSHDSRVKVLVIATQEELEIAQQAQQCMAQAVSVSV
jgi:acetate kinase